MCPCKYKILKLKNGPEVIYAKFYLKVIFQKLVYCIRKKNLINWDLFPVFYLNLYRVSRM
jgi:hypothetical protein